MRRAYTFRTIRAESWGKLLCVAAIMARCRMVSASRATSLNFQTAAIVSMDQRSNAATFRARSRPSPTLGKRSCRHDANTDCSRFHKGMMRRTCSIVIVAKMDFAADRDNASAAASSSDPARNAAITRSRRSLAILELKRPCTGCACVWEGAVVRESHALRTVCVLNNTNKLTNMKALGLSPAPR